MDRDPGLQAMQDIIDRMTREGASQEDIDAALMEFAYRHEHEKDAVAVKLPGLPDNADAEMCYLRACGLFEAFRDDEAAACLRRTLELQPDHYDARRMLIQLEDDDETLCQDLAALDEELEARWLHGHGAGESAAGANIATEAATNEAAADAGAADAGSGASGAAAAATNVATAANVIAAANAAASVATVANATASAWEDPLGRTMLLTKADRAFLNYDLGRYRTALAACERALELDSADHQNLRGLLAMIYVYFEDAESLRALHERYDCEESSWFLLAETVLAYKNGDLDAVRKHFDRFLALYPDLLVEFSLFMAGSEPPSHHPSKRDKQRTDVYSALEDAVAVVDSTPGFLAWISDTYASQLFDE